jgi:hypothetical protein
VLAKKSARARSGAIGCAGPHPVDVAFVLGIRLPAKPLGGSPLSSFQDSHFSTTFSAGSTATYRRPSQGFAKTRRPLTDTIGERYLHQSHGRCATVQSARYAGGGTERDKEGLWLPA